MTPVGIVWVLTWLWQGCLVTAAAAVVLRVTTRINAATRFLAWWVTLAAVLVLAGVQVSPQRWAVTVSTPSTWSSEVAVTQPLSSRDTDALTDTVSTFPLTVPPTPSLLAFTLATLWVGFAILRLARLVVSLGRLRALKRAAVPLSADIERDLSHWLAIRHRGRRTQLRVTSGVATASMLGVGSPVIALPRQLIDSLDRADLDRVVMHEYGHVQRYDDWTIVAQAAIEAVFGWRQ